ncbi:unnamed protein product [Amoebophrya sp. A120]|nr:unnamed protein product [Amoebophrya sp. A120]|eukprot:GSA120T00008687001.1
MSSFLPHAISGRKKTCGPPPAKNAVCAPPRAENAEAARSTTIKPAATSTQELLPGKRPQKLQDTVDSLQNKTQLLQSTTLRSSDNEFLARTNQTNLPPSFRTRYSNNAASTTLSRGPAAAPSGVEHPSQGSKQTPNYAKPRLNAAGFGNFRRNQSRLKQDEEHLANSAIFQAAQRFSNEMEEIGKSLQGFGSRKRELNDKYFTQKKSLYVGKRDKDVSKSTVKDIREIEHNPKHDARQALEEEREGKPPTDCEYACDYLRRDLDNYVEHRKACVAAEEFGASKKSENFLATVWASELVVGDLWLPGSTAVNCFDDRFEYKVAKHPEEGLVYMFMSFKHFESVTYDQLTKKVSFRLPKTLRYYAKYYKPEARPDHVLSLTFATEKDATKFLYNVYNVYLKKK